MADNRRDFFISFNSADLAYAEAIDTALREAGFTTFFHPNDLAPNGVIPVWMDDSLLNSGQTLALYSPDYVKNDAVYSRAELHATWWQDPGNEKRKLIPIVLRETQFSPLTMPIKKIYVTGMTRDEAAAHIIKELHTPNEAEQIDVWRRGLPLPKIFQAAYRPNPNFTGRFEALNSLQHTLRAGTNAAVTAVAGMGGVGKTTLAAEYCHRFGGRYAGVWWIRAEQETIMLADIADLGTRLRIEQTAFVEENARATLGYLAAAVEPWLLIYDNAPNPDAVRKWLPSGAVRCIITSRFTEFSDLASVTRLDQWSDDTTTEYLATRTGRDDLEGARKLAETLGGLPLAAEQAAVFLRTRANISFEEYREALSKLIKHARQLGATGEYPDTVYAAFVKSLEAVELLQQGETALNVLKLCAFLSPDGVDLAMLKTGGGTTLPVGFSAAISDMFMCADALTTLTSLSLMHQIAGEDGPILVFHRLLLAVVRDRMKEIDTSLWSASAAKLVWRAFPSDFRMMPSSWTVCARLMPHVMPLETFLPRTKIGANSLYSLLSEAGSYLQIRGDHQGALDLQLRSIARANETDSDQALIGRSKVLNNLGSVLADLGRLDEAEQAYKESIAIRESALEPESLGLMIVLSNLGEVYFRRREFQRAAELIKRSTEITEKERGPESAEYGVALSNLGALYCDWADEPGQEAKRVDEAKFKTKALTVTRIACGTRHPSTAVRYYNLSVMRRKAGNIRDGVANVERTVAIMMSLDLFNHPHMQQRLARLLAFWNEAGQIGKMKRLQEGDLSDLIQTVVDIEAEHRVWVAEDPQNRHFGPPSPITKATE